MPRLPPVSRIKPRFIDIQEIVRKVPEDDFCTALEVNAPYAENLLLRNRERVQAGLRQVVPVYENTFEEDDWTDREDPETPQVLKLFAERQRLRGC